MVQSDSLAERSSVDELRLTGRVRRSRLSCCTTAALAALVLAAPAGCQRDSSGSAGPSPSGDSGGPPGDGGDVGAAADAAELGLLPDTGDLGSPADVAQDTAAPDSGHTPGCFRAHLEEAIALNERRRPLYSALSQGRSEAVSDTLISSERMSLLFADQVDTGAATLQAAGVTIVCDEFIPMSEAPEFQERFDFEPAPLADLRAVDGQALTEQLQTAFDEGGFAALSELCDSVLADYESPRAYNCMLRHMLESLRRIADYAPVHAAQARELGLQGALELSDTMVRLHLVALAAAATLDEQAAPLQAEGLPIICRDVPHIPPGPAPSE